MSYSQRSQYVPFLENEDLEREIKSLLNKASEIQRKMTDEKMHKNVMDPFGALIEQAGFNLSHEQWLDTERNRQMQKSLNNAVGEFHQRVIGKMKGWEDLNVGRILDLANHEKKIVAEVKNKHNTVTGGKLMNVYDLLDSAISDKFSKYKGYTAYFVQIIPAKPERYNKPFTPSDTTTGRSKNSNFDIRVIDGYSFYELASGEVDAYARLFKCLPEVIKNCKPDSDISIIGALELFRRAYG